MIVVFVCLFGLCLGSFVNALVWRLHEQARRGGAKPSKELSILHGRSMCPHCKHSLTAKDLVPLFSWLQLRGKCRYCREPISAQYPLVELLGAALFGVSYLFWPYELTAMGIALLVTWLAALVCMLALAVYDARWQLLPTRLIVPLTCFAAVFAVLRYIALHNTASDVLQLGGAVLLLFGLFFVLFELSKGKYIGFGDVRLALSLGLFAGSFVNGIVLLFVASFTGTLAALPLVAAGKKKLSGKLPFGPYLLFGCFVAVVFGQHIIDWVNDTFFNFGVF